MKKTLAVIVGFIAVIVLSFAFKQPAKPLYENLKVLPKNTTKQQMDSIMRHFSSALGVRCNYCHVRGRDAQNNFNFASDSLKHKGEARGMFRMMSKINKKYFKVGKDAVGLKVTCYSCHHGKEEPATLPPPPPPRTQQPAPPNQQPASPPAQQH